MADPLAQRLSRTIYTADGTTTNWNFTFSGGYLSKSHVKVSVRPAGGRAYNVPITDASFIGPYQLRLTPAITAGAELTIYRDTPKDLPLVDFTDGSAFTEASLDLNAKQAVFIAAEAQDEFGTTSYQTAEEAAAIATTKAAVALAAADVAEDAASAAAASAADAGVLRTDLANTAQGDSLIATASSGGLWSTVRGFIAYLRSEAGAAVIGVKQAVTGSLARTVRDELRDHLTLTQFAGVDRSGATSSTVGLQRAVDEAIAGGRLLKDVRGGIFLTGPLDWNGTGHATPEHSGYSGLQAFEGTSRYGSTIIKADPAASWTAGQAVITANNIAGKTITKLEIQGSDIEWRNPMPDGPFYGINAMNLTWIGGSGGNASLAPSNECSISEVSFNGFKHGGIVADNFNDVEMRAIWGRGTDHGKVALSVQGGGGTVWGYNVILSTGLLQVACQNGGFEHSGFYGGVRLTGTSYNCLTWGACHFYEDPTTHVILNSLTVEPAGNFASQGQVFNTCYFNDTVGYIFSGRWHTGATFNGGKLGAFAALCHPTDFIPAGGAGQVPVFTFKGTSFFGPVPVSVPGKYKVRLLDCRGAGGAIITTNDLGEIISTGQNHALGTAKVRSASADLAVSEHVSIPFVLGTGMLAVHHYNPANATIRTATLYHIVGHQGYDVASFVMSTDDGAAPCPIVLGWADNMLTIANASGVPSHVEATFWVAGA